MVVSKEVAFREDLEQTKEKVGANAFLVENSDRLLPSFSLVEETGGCTTRTS